MSEQQKMEIDPNSPEKREVEILQEETEVITF